MVSADISDPLSVIGIVAKFHIGASLDSMAMKTATPTVLSSELMMPLWSMEDYAWTVYVKPQPE